MRKEPLYFRTYIDGSHHNVIKNLDSIEPFGSIGWGDYKVYMTEEQFDRYKKSGRKHIFETYICLSPEGELFYLRGEGCLGRYIKTLSEKEQAIVKENIVEIMMAFADY